MKFNKNFHLLLAGQSLANIGDVLYIVSVISVIFRLTGSATAAAFVPFLITTAMFVSNALTPLLMGRFNLKGLLAGSQTVKTILMITLAILLPAMTSTTYYAVFFIIACIAFLDGCATPVTKSLLPVYVNDELLLKANSITETVTQLIQTVMWFIGSLLLVLASANGLIWATAGLFFCSRALLVFLVKAEFTSSNTIGKWDQLKLGWHTVSKTPTLKRIAWMDFFETIAGTVWIAAILYVFVSDVLHAGEAWWGYINGAFSLGLIGGSLFCLKFSSIVDKNFSFFVFFGAVASCFATVLFGLTSLPWAALILSLLLGVFAQLKNIPQQTLVQTSVPKDHLPMVFTTLGAIGTGTFGVASLLMGILADLFGVRSAFLFSGLLLAMVGLISFKGKAQSLHSVHE
ncbi:MFS transporter [Planococcus sp. YIM B11945]|uniref:MFS transporter n=1 Tax=Planococcus sp. YIM B11945 TaxID=3435410 RepID=UPI003D7D24F9